MKKLNCASVVAILAAGGLAMSGTASAEGVTVATADLQLSPAAIVVNADYFGVEAFSSEGEVFIAQSQHKQKQKQKQKSRNFSAELETVYSVPMNGFSV